MKWTVRLGLPSYVDEGDGEGWWEPPQVITMHFDYVASCDTKPTVNFSRNGECVVVMNNDSSPSAIKQLARFAREDALCQMAGEYERVLVGVKQETPTDGIENDGETLKLNVRYERSV